MCVCNQKICDRIMKYVNYTYRIWLLNLPVCGVCAAWRADWDWVTERVQGFVKCLLFLIRDWCHWPVVHWLVSCFDRKVACKSFPSNLFGCPCCMILKALRFLLWFRSHSCYSIYAMRKPILDYWFVRIVCVPCAPQGSHTIRTN